MEKNVAIPEDLLAAVSETAQAQGKTPEQVIEDATRLYLAKVRLQRFSRRNEDRAQSLGIKESDVPGHRQRVAPRTAWALSGPDHDRYEH